MKKNESSSRLISNKKNFPMTIVSSYFDISRKARPNKAYFKWLKETTKLNAPFIFYTQSKFKNKIESIFNSNKKKNFRVIPIELEDLDYYEDIQTVKDILKSKEYKNKMEDPYRIECTNPLYSIVTQEKFTLLAKSVHFNPFNSSKFIWMDAGINRFYKNFTQELTGKNIKNDLFIIPLHSGSINDTFFQSKNESIIWSHKNYFITTLMGGSKKAILNASLELKKKWKHILNNRVINNEQIVLNLVFFEKPFLFDLKLIYHQNRMVELLNFLI